MTNGAAMDPRPHPAKYSDSIIEVLTDLLASRQRFPGLVVDPFAGVGRVHFGLIRRIKQRLDTQDMTRLHRVL